MTDAHITDALRELVFEPDPQVELDTVLDRHYSADYTHRSDGATLDRAAFAAMVAASRTQIVRGSAVVVNELQVGTDYAERHRFRVELADGTVQDREVAVFGTVDAQGRFTHLSETGFALRPDEVVR